MFLNLRDKLKLLGLLQDSRNVSAEEGLAMRLRIPRHGTTQRIICDLLAQIANQERGGGNKIR